MERVVFCRGIDTLRGLLSRCFGTNVAWDLPYYNWAWCEHNILIFESLKEDI